MLAVLFVLQFAAVYVVVEHGKYLVILIIISVISRSCSGISILCLKAMPQSGYANMFKQDVKISHKIFIILIVLSASALSFIFMGIYGLIAVLSVILGYIGAMAYAYKDLKGISGDLAGYALVISELCGLAALAVI
jgi:adenosylcobinamide-GDP ribazoletransferase